MSNPIRDVPKYLSIFETYLGKKIYISFFLTLTAAIAEGFGILMFLPLLQTLGGAVDQFATPSQQQTPESQSGLTPGLLRVLDFLGLGSSTLSLLAFITIAFLLKGLLTFGAMGFNAHLRASLLKVLKIRMFEAISGMSLTYYVKRDTGHFINLVNEQINRAIQSFFDFSQMVAQLVNTIVYLCMAFVVAWNFGAMALIAGIIILAVFKSINSYVRGISREVVNENAHLANLLIQTLQSFKYLLSTNQIDRLGNRIRSSISRLALFESRMGLASAFTQSSREPIAVVLIMAIVMVQVEYLNQPVAPILVSIILFYRGLNATLAMQKEWQHTLQCIGSLEYVNVEFSLIASNKEFSNDRNLNLRDSSDIELKDVSFSFSSELPPVLVGINLNIPAKSTVAFVGESGAGKSTLVDLITLAQNPTSGDIYIDGTIFEEIPSKLWRQRIGYVSQETVIFDETIENNISMFDEINPISVKREKVERAVRQAHLSAFISTLPDGYDTMVGERGVRLSGGQRQRLFIARELYRDPSLLILDEATSALDSESEIEIQKSIDELKGAITVIVIAHRLSTIRNVDRIYVFDKGRIVEQGTYDELLRMSNGKFCKLASLQTL